MLRVVMCAQSVRTTTWARVATPPVQPLFRNTGDHGSGAVPTEAGVPNRTRHAELAASARAALSQHLAALARAGSVRVREQEAEDRDEDGHQQAHGAEQEPHLGGEDTQLAVACGDGRGERVQSSVPFSSAIMVRMNNLKFKILERAYARPGFSIGGLADSISRGPKTEQ